MLSPPRAASDPVSWFEWGEEAFRKAQVEGKPIVLDVGAAWCHGCRVMDRETYGDPEVAGFLNRDYVPIRVDSDRRPDLHERYNLGGWPTTAFLTPAGKLLGGSTYVACDQMKQLLVQLKVAYSTQKARLEEEIDRRDAKIAEVLEARGAPRAPVNMEILRKTMRGILVTFDPLHAGFGQAPKFPMVASLRVILLALHETQGPDFQQVFLRTLDAMGDRGMFDSVNGGFFHYVTNDVWTLPRFEKLCEDNAALAKLYLDASVVTGVDRYLDRARRTLEWARATLLDAERGAFFGSQYADEDYYTAVPKARAKRPLPEVDRTVFTPAAAAMASAFLRATEVTGEASWGEIGLRALDFLLTECVQEGRTAHYYDGEPKLFDLLRDGTALAGALLDARDHAGEARHLEAAEEIMEGIAARFWPDPERGLVDRAVDSPGLGVLAQARRNLPENAQAAENFARLWRLTGEEGHRERAGRLITAFPDLLDGYGHMSAEYALAADWLVREPGEVRAAPGSLQAFVPRRLVLHEASS